ncbi:MAG: hypothetical protein AB7U61_14925 [Methylocystis sp.]
MATAPSVADLVDAREGQSEARADIPREPDLTYDWNARAADQVPFVVELDGGHRLNIENIACPIAGALASKAR